MVSSWSEIIISWMQACTFVYNHFQNCVRDVFFLPRLRSVTFPSCVLLLIYLVCRHIGNTPSLSHRQFGQANLPPLDLQMLSDHTIVVETVNVSLGIWFVIWFVIIFVFFKPYLLQNTPCSGFGDSGHKKCGAGTFYQFHVFHVFMVVGWLLLTITFLAYSVLTRW